MKLETFFEKFDRLADAPNAVAKMRELTLELAVQGKLVEQRPAEGDGHALLKLIHKKNPPSHSEPEAESLDAELPGFPVSWAPSKLGEVAEIIRGVSFPGSAKSETRSDGEVACLRTASVQAEIDWDDLIYISPSHVSRADQWVAPNDIMISMANSYALVGKVAIVRKVPQKATFGAFLAAIRPILIEPYFLLYVLRSPRMQAAFRASSSQTTNIANISLGRMRPLPFPLPPLIEQKRIVAKVDELMALCDRLEAQQQEREARHATLARASLARFADAPTPAKLPLLFHPSYPIFPTDLRKSILNLAVRGKLVPQDPKDEPAAASVEQVRKDAKKAIRNGIIRRHGLEETLDDRDLSDLPLGWRWTRLVEVTRPVPYAIKRGPFGSAIRKDMFVLTGFKVYEQQHAISGDFTKGSYYINEAKFDELSAFELFPGEILVSCSGTVGKVAIVPTNIDRGIINQALLKLSLHQSALLNDYFLILFPAFFMETDTLTNLAGTAQKNIPGMDVLKAMPFPLPPFAEQRRIVAKVDQLMAFVDELERLIDASQISAKVLLDAVVAELAGPLPSQ